MLSGLKPLSLTPTCCIFYWLDFSFWSLADRSIPVQPYSVMAYSFFPSNIWCRDLPLEQCMVCSSIHKRKRWTGHILYQTHLYNLSNDSWVAFSSLDVLQDMHLMICFAPRCSYLLSKRWLKALCWRGW